MKPFMPWYTSLPLTLIGAANLSLVLYGCFDDKPKVVEAPQAEKQTISRFTIERHGEFRAGFENNRREIVVLTDTRTGKQYLVVTGAGCSELHAQSNGKTTTTVEE